MVSFDVYFQDMETSAGLSIVMKAVPVKSWRNLISLFNCDQHFSQMFTFSADSPSFFYGSGKCWQNGGMIRLPDGKFSVYIKMMDDAGVVGL